MVHGKKNPAPLRPEGPLPALPSGVGAYAHGGIVTPRYEPRQVKGASPQVRPAFMTRRFGG